MAINPRSRVSLIVGTWLVITVISLSVLWHRPQWKEYGLSTIKEVTSQLGGDTNTDSYNPEDQYIAICVAIKDQGRDLPEFLQHHHYNIGINRFYLMDDGSQPPLSSLANTYGVPPEILTFVYYDAAHRAPAQQLKAYDDAIAMFGHNHTWMAFIDADEFIDTPGPQTLHEILKGLEPLSHVGALGINWQIHTSNHVLTRPESVRQAFTECIVDTYADGAGTDSIHIKSIVRTASYLKPDNPHKFSLKDGAITVGELGDTIDTLAFRHPITRTRVNLHHYAVKSKQEYEEKINRSNGMGNPKGWEFWNHIETDIAHVTCDQMLRWFP